MATTEHQGMSGRVTILLKDSSGKVLDRRLVKNVITDAGKNLVAKFFTGEIQATTNLTIAVGSDPTPESAADLALGALVDQAAAGTGVENAKASVTATLSATETGITQELREAGIMINLPGDQPPVLYNRVTFDVVNKSPNMEMTLTWEVVF